MNQHGAALTSLPLPLHIPEGLEITEIRTFELLEERDKIFHDREKAAEALCMASFGFDTEALKESIYCMMLKFLPIWCLKRAGKEMLEFA